MNRERIKSLLLSALVLLSIILTQQIWFSFPIDRVLPSLRVEREHRLDTSLLSTLIPPHRIIVNLEGNRRTVLLDNNNSSPVFNGIWKSSWPIMRTALSMPSTEYKTAAIEDWQNVRNRRSIEVNFTSPLSVEVLANLVGAERITESVKNINNLLITANDNPTVMLMDTQQKKIISIRLLENNNQLNQLITKVDNNNIVKYYPLAEIINIKEENNSDLALLNVLSPVSDREKIEGSYSVNITKYNKQQDVYNVAQSFFKENSNIRSIKETNGANIFMDGEQGVRIAPDGKIEYLNYNVESKMDYQPQVDEYTALSIAGQFLMDTKLWQQSLVVSEIVPFKEGRSQGYHIYFNHMMEGKLVLGEDQELSLMPRIEILGNKVKSYSGFILQFKNVYIGPQYVLNPVIDIMGKNIDLLISENAELGINNTDELMKALSNISLVLYKQHDGDLDSGECRLIDGWKLRIKDKRYIFNATTGEFLGKIDSKDY